MSLPSPRSLFRVTAAAEMVTWAGLLTAMALKYTGVTDAVMPIAGGIHGFVFLCYFVVTVAVWIDGRWPAARGLLGLGSAVVPFMTVPFERAQLRRGEPAPHWRVLEGEPGERTGAQRVLAAVLGRPLVSALVALIAHDWLDALIVLAIVIASALVGSLHEVRSNRAIARLREQVASRADVWRDGRLQSLAADEVVPGDIVELSAGSLLPADGRLVEARETQAAGR